MDKCGICLKPAEQLFETGKEGVYACFRCQPLVPEVSIQDTVEQGQAPSSDIIEIVVESINNDDELLEAASDELFCGICNKTFQKNGQLQAHLRNHRAERRFVCTYCNKAFSQSNNLRAHLRIHTNERPYKCSECGKAFTQVTNLNNHVRLHTGERPFICPEPGCNKAYAQVTNLNQHRKRHENGRLVESYYECPVCGDKFQQRNHMYTHRRTAHGGGAAVGVARPRPPARRHVCALCDTVLPSEKQLQAHVAAHSAPPAPAPDTSDDVSDSTKAELSCVFRSCGARFATPHEHTEHLLRAHQLRVLTNSPPAAPQAKRGRPPKHAGSGPGCGSSPGTSPTPQEADLTQPPSFDFVSVEKIKAQPVTIHLKPPKTFRPIKIVNATKFMPNIKIQGLQ